MYLHVQVHHVCRSRWRDKSRSPAKIVITLHAQVVHVHVYVRGYNMKQFDVFVLQICAGIATLAFFRPLLHRHANIRHFYLPVSHLAPSYPAAQSHSNLFSRLLQAPPFWHGDDAHSLMSVRKVTESTTCTAISCIYMYIVRLLWDKCTLMYPKTL